MKMMVLNMVKWTCLYSIKAGACPTTAVVNCLPIQLNQPLCCQENEDNPFSVDLEHIVSVSPYSINDVRVIPLRNIIEPVIYMSLADNVNQAFVSHFPNRFETD